MEGSVDTPSTTRSVPGFDLRPGSPCFAHDKRSDGTISSVSVLEPCDNIEPRQVSVPGAGGLKLIFDGQNLQCHLERSAADDSDPLSRGPGVVASLIR